MMKFCLKKIIAYAILVIYLSSCGSPNASKLHSEQLPAEPEISDQIEMPFTGVSIPGADLRALVGLTVEESIKILNKRGDVEIVILEKMTAYQSSKNIKYENSDAVKNELKWLKSTFNAELTLGMYLPPYLGKSKNGETQKRAFEDKGIIFLTRNADRHALIHEFMHHLIFLAQEPEYIFESSGEKYHKKDLFHLRENHENLVKSVDAFSKNQTNELLFVLLNDINKLSTNIKSIINTPSQELDITRYMYEHSDILELTEENKILDVFYHSSNLGHTTSPIEEKSLFGVMNLYNEMLVPQLTENIFNLLPDELKVQIPAVAIETRFRQTLPPLAKEASIWFKKELSLLLQQPKVQIELARIIKIREQLKKDSEALK